MCRKQSQMINICGSVTTSNPFYFTFIKVLISGALTISEIAQNIRLFNNLRIPWVSFYISTFWMQMAVISEWSWCNFFSNFQLISCLYFTGDPQILLGEKFSQILVPSHVSKLQQQNTFPTLSSLSARSIEGWPHKQLKMLPWGFLHSQPYHTRKRGDLVVRL